MNLRILEDAQDGWILWVAIAATIVIAAFLVWLICFIIRKRNIKKSDLKVDEKIKESTSSVASYFGGKKNIKEILSKGSRVSVEVEDIKLVDRPQISAHFESVIFMGNKIVFVVGSKSESFAEELQNNIKDE